MAKIGVVWYNVGEISLRGGFVVSQAEFSGNFTHTLDSKGRVIIPISFREQLGEQFTICLSGNFKSIALYPKEEWRSTNESLAHIPDADLDGMEYVRLISGFAFTNCDLDAQGRVLLPAPLRQMTNMNKAIRFVGVIRHFEVWDEDSFMAHIMASQANIVNLSAHVNRRLYEGGS